MNFVQLSAVAAMAMAIPAVAAAEPIALVCTGSGVASHSDILKKDAPTTYSPYQFSFELIVDLEAKTVLRDGEPWHLWSATEDELVVSADRPGSLTARLGGPGVVVSRRTGIFRTYKRETGRCEIGSAAQKLF